MTGYRVRLRAVVSDYHRAAPVDGPDFDRAADLLAEVLAADHPPARIVSALDALIGTTRHRGVAVLLLRARERVINDPAAVGRAANDAVNARIVATDHRDIA